MNDGTPASPGFVERRARGRWWMVRADLEDALLAGPLGRAELLTRDVPRGSAARAPGPDGPVVIRAYRRGGWLGGLSLPHASVGRFRTEVLTALEARRRGLPVPEPLGSAARRAGPGWRGFAVIREIPGARDLRAALRDAGPGPAARALVERALGLVRRAHDAGLTHPDLNLGNLVEDGEGSLWIVDLDRARLGEPRDHPGRLEEIARLDRSMEKLFGETLLDRATRDDLLVGYAGDDAVLAAFVRDRLDRHRRRLARHRRLW